MKIQPISNLNFGNKRIYQRTIYNSCGRCIQGQTKEHELFVYVAENPITKAIKHKLYVINKLMDGEGRHKWLKSYLRFYNENSDNKMIKEMRSSANGGR